MRAGIEEDIARRFVSLCSGAAPPYFFWHSPEGETLMSAGVRRALTPPQAGDWREWVIGPLNLEMGIPTLILSFFDPDSGAKRTWPSFYPVHCYQPASGLLLRNGVKQCWGDAESIEFRDERSATRESQNDTRESHNDTRGPRNDTPADAQPRNTAVPDWGEEEYRSRVEAALVHLRSDELGKVVIARQCRVPLPKPGDIRNIISGMLRQPHSFAVCYSPDGEQYFLSATPERLGRIAGGRFETMALAGTMTGSGVADNENSREGSGSSGNDAAAFSHEGLLADMKERAEHAFVVDMIRQAVGTFATEVTTKDVNVMELPHLRHILTGISGRTRAGRGLRHAIAALHPTPAVAGTPRVEAMRLINMLEPFDRGMYAGCAGWFLGEEEGDCAVTIRSALLRGSEALLWAGAGIVRESDPVAEERETRAKLQTMFGILGG
jgi:isochorismate synthase